MTEPRILETPAGPLRLTPPSDATLAALRTLFADVATIADSNTSTRMLGLLFSVDGAAKFGLRTGYGWLKEGPDDEDVLQTWRVGRFLIPHALQRFRQRGFRGVLLPASCMTGTKGQPAQVGELQFIAPSGAMRDGRGVGAIETYERRFGAGATEGLMTFAFDLGECWAKMGAKRTLTDIEPCPHLHEAVRWEADLVLVDDRLFLARPDVRDDDPLLAEIVRAGITEVEFTPSAFVLVPLPRRTAE